MKKISIGFLILYFGLIIFFQLFSGCMSFRLSQKEVDEHFANQKYKPTQHQIDVNGRTINYAEIGNDSLPVAFFVHGSPGSWSAWEGFFKDSLLLTKVKMVAVDRPGFGYSGLGKGEKLLTEQSKYLRPILEKYAKDNEHDLMDFQEDRNLKNSKESGKIEHDLKKIKEDTIFTKKGKIILIGHSLGGPMIARMAMDYPELIDNLIFVAASNSPDLEPARWYRFIGDFVLFRYLIPKSFRASNREILYVKPELEKMLPLWKNITQKAIIIQGDKDVLVPYQNAEFTRKMLVNADAQVIMKKDMNHFVPWSNPELIKEAILKFAE
jgi:pimeloyl-ACP methyl ester carboxylesterase